MRFALTLILTLFLVPFAQASSESTWSKEFESGYISTKPLIVEDTVFVRTSGQWTGDERPIVAAFEIESGNELWRYTSETSLQHDMSPLLFIEKGEGNCGEWQDMLLVGWADGKVTALSAMNGTVIWENETEVDVLGVTGKMTLDDDRLVVPTRTGLSVFCLADGLEFLDIDTGNIGWRNGVTISNGLYVYGDESGNLHRINRDGEISSIFLGEGKIRHAPIETRHGLFVHLQTSEGSTMYLNGSILANAGHSPAIPIYHENRIYAATSDEWMSILCDEVTCTIDSTESFHANGEMALRVIDSGVEIWAPFNTPNGGWGVFNQTSLVRMETSTFDTYGTAAPGFDSDAIALGNDAGILFVQHPAQAGMQSETTDSNVMGMIHYVAILVFFVLTCFSFALHDLEKIVKFGSTFLLVVALAVVPELSLKLAEKTAPESDVQWNNEWPDEWKGTQVIVVEIDGQEQVIGGLEPQDSVYELTVLACEELGITTQIEQQYLGAYLVSFNGLVGDGWEFTIDGNWSPVGMADAELDDTSIVEWRPV